MTDRDCGCRRGRREEVVRVRETSPFRGDSVSPERIVVREREPRERVERVIIEEDRRGRRGRGGCGGGCGEGGWGGEFGGWNRGWGGGCGGGGCCCNENVGHVSEGDEIAMVEFKAVRGKHRANLDQLGIANGVVAAANVCGTCSAGFSNWGWGQNLSGCCSGTLLGNFVKNHSAAGFGSVGNYFYGPSGFYGPDFSFNPGPLPAAVWQGQPGMPHGQHMGQRMGHPGMHPGMQMGGMQMGGMQGNPYMNGQRPALPYAPQGAYPYAAPQPNGAYGAYQAYPRKM